MSKSLNTPSRNAGVERNGIKYPQRGIIADIWAKLDTARGAVKAEHLPRLAKESKWNIYTVRTQFYKWMAWNGGSKPTRRAATTKATAKAVAKVAQSPRKPAKKAPVTTKAPTKKALPPLKRRTPGLPLRQSSKSAAIPFAAD